MAYVKNLLDIEDEIISLGGREVKHYKTGEHYDLASARMDLSEDLSVNSPIYFPALSRQGSKSVEIPLGQLFGEYELVDGRGRSPCESTLLNRSLEDVRISRVAKISFLADKAREELRK